MKRPFCLLVVVLLLTPLAYSDEKPKAPDYAMALVMLYSDDVASYEWVVTLNNSIAFKSIDGLKTFLQKRPKGTTIEWAPGCCRLGDEPLLNSEAELRDFKLFCETNGIVLTIRPSG